MKKLTEQEKDAIMKVDINADKEEKEGGMMWLHCASCLKRFQDGEIGEGQSPKEAMKYAASSYPFTYPDGTTAGIVVVWCELCGKQVWDSRHLTSLI